MRFSAEQVAGHRVIMLSGDEEALRRRGFADLIELATADGDFDLQTFEADVADPEEWIASAGTAPFLSRRRTVVVRHLLRREWEKKRGKVPANEEPSDAEGDAAPERPSKPPDFSNLPESALLILVADEEPGDDTRQRRLGTIRKAWEKLVAGQGGFVADFKTNPQAMAGAIKDEAGRLGKKISDGTANSLAEMTGSNFSRAAEELEKLAVYLGSESEIRETHLRLVVIPSREYDVYKLIRSIVDGSVPEALRQLRILVGSQTKAETAAFSRILPTMSRQLRLIWQARICVERKCSPSSAPPEVLALFSEAGSIAKVASFQQQQAMQFARRMSFAGLRRCFAAVSDADARLKGLRSGFSAIDTLERMVLEMIAVAAPRPVAR